MNGCSRFIFIKSSCNERNCRGVNRTFPITLNNVKFEFKTNQNQMKEERKAELNNWSNILSFPCWRLKIVNSCRVRQELCLTITLEKCKQSDVVKLKSSFNYLGWSTKAELNSGIHKWRLSKWITKRFLVLKISNLMKFKSKSIR